MRLILVSPWSNIAYLIAILAMCSSSFAQIKTITDAREAAVTAYVSGLMLESACPTWRINGALAILSLRTLDIGDDDFAEGKKYHNLFMQTVINLRPALADLKEQEACDKADDLFGPTGLIVPNYMKRRSK